MWWRHGFVAGLIFFSTSLVAHGKDRYVEVGVLGSYSKSSFGNGSFSRSKRYTATAALYLTSTTQIEISYTDATSQYYQTNYPRSETTTRDRILGLTLNQSLVPTTWFLQPYVKAGAAQLNRKQVTVVNNTDVSESRLKQPSAVAGAGAKIFLGSAFSFKFEVTTYMPNFHVKAARDNYDWEFGLSFHL